MLAIYFKTIRDKDFKKIDTYRNGSLVYINEATLEDLNTLSKIIHIYVSDLRDSLDKYELPRMETIDQNMGFFVRHPSQTDPGLHTETLTIVTTVNLLIVISPHHSEIIEGILSSASLLSTTQKTKLLIYILLKITQEYTNSIKKVRQTIIGVEQPLDRIDSNAIIVLTKNEEILNQYLTSLVPMRNLLDSMSSGRFVKFYEQDLDLLEDLMIALRQSEDVCRVNIKSIRSLRDSYHIIFTNDVNRTIKLLTAVTIVFTIPTIMASIYGMNVSLPFQNTAHAFFLVMGITILASIIAIWLFRKKHWL